MPIHKPTPPVEFIREVYLEPRGLSERGLADSLGVSPATVMRIINRTSGISPEMALRLGKALGRSPEIRLTMQHNHHLWQARQALELSGVRSIGSHFRHRSVAVCAAGSY